MTSDPALLRLIADAVLAAHVAFVAFVVVGLLLIVAGGFRGWAWIRNRWFRLAHLAAIGVVVVQAWLGVLCPLTSLEMHIRERAGERTYGGSFIEYWLGELLYYEAPSWVFMIAYTLFALLVAGCWIAFRPRPFRSRKEQALGP